jgi:FolB domain-containing protein
MEAEPQNLDCIHIRDLFLRCIIGINPEERTKRQDVLINITLYTDLSHVCQSDRIEDTIDYKKVKKRVVEIVEQSSYFLIERLAGRIAELCLEPQPVQKVRVLVEKPGALRFARSVGVEIVRTREQET